MPKKKVPPQTIQKKVTWGKDKDREEEEKKSKSNRLGLEITSKLHDATDSLDDTQNVVGDETEEYHPHPKNSLFDKDNIFTRFGAVSEIKSIRDT